MITVTVTQAKACIIFAFLRSFSNPKTQSFSWKTFAWGMRNTLFLADERRRAVGFCNSGGPIGLGSLVL